MGFSRQEYCSGLPFPSPGDHSDPGIEPGSPVLRVDALLSELLGKPSREATKLTDSETNARGRVLIKHSDSNLK